MSVTWTDTPGSTLPTRSEPVDFSATGDVVAISVGYGPGRSEERVYRDGGFLAPFTESTKVGTTYTIRRAGGWPSAPTVYIDEAPEQGAVSWGTVYQVDLTAQPTQSMTTPGNYTIDGHTWWVKGQGTSNRARLDNGLGLGLEWLSGATAFARSGDLTYHVLWFPFAQLAGFEPTVPVSVSYRIAGGPYSAAESYALGGLASLTNSGAYVTSSERGFQLLWGTGGHYATSSAGPSQQTISAVGSQPGDHLWGVMRAAVRTGLTYHAAWTVGLAADPFTMTDAVTSLTTDSTPTNLGFLMVTNAQSTFLPYLTHLRIVQPGAES